MGQLQGICKNYNTCIVIKFAEQKDEDIIKYNTSIHIILRLQ